MRALFPPESSGQPSGQPNVQMAQDPTQMTGYQKGELGIRQQELGQEQQKTAQAGKLGQEAVDVRTAQEKLNQQKSDQINTQKQADMQRKIDESNQKIELAQNALKQKSDNAEAQLEAHKTLATAVEERHKLELAQKDAQFKQTSEQHQQTIDRLQQQVDDNKNTTKTETDSTGNSKTTTTSKGGRRAPVKNPDGTYTVYGPNGISGTIPAANLDDWNANHQNAPDAQ
jgi:hypothetical protein